MVHLLFCACGISQRHDFYADVVRFRNGDFSFPSRTPFCFQELFAAGWIEWFRFLSPSLQRLCLSYSFCYNCYAFFKTCPASFFIIVSGVNISGIPLIHLSLPMNIVTKCITQENLASIRAAEAWPVLYQFQSLRLKFVF